MSLFNYHFIDLSTAEKQVRRQTLDKYALYAQLSILAPVAVLLIYRLWKQTSNAGASEGRYAPVPSSPVLKERRNSHVGTWSSRSRRLQWWLGEDVVVAGWVLGQRDRTYNPPHNLRFFQMFWAPWLTSGQNGSSGCCGALGCCCFLSQKPGTVSHNPSLPLQCTNLHRLPALDQEIWRCCYFTMAAPIPPGAQVT